MPSRGEADVVAVGLRLAEIENPLFSRTSSGKSFFRRRGRQIRSLGRGEDEEANRNAATPDIAPEPSPRMPGEARRRPVIVFSCYLSLLEVVIGTSLVKLLIESAFQAPPLLNAARVISLPCLKREESAQIRGKTDQRTDQGKGGEDDKHQQIRARQSNQQRHR